MNVQKECVCCGNEKISGVWELPSLPLTGIYLNNPGEFDFQNFHDEIVQFCGNCSHMQLSNPVDPDLLYLKTYTHRTSQSPISNTGNLFLEHEIRKFLRDTRPQQVLEIGCNDGLLLSKIRDAAHNLAGFDPVLQEGIETKDGNVTLMGGFGETVDYDHLLAEKVDFVVSAHTFEHIVDPRMTLERLKPHLAERFDFVIEVPSSVSMVDQVRMDQVFPQHVNYYSPASMAALMKPLGLHLVKSEHNFRYWGGTQLLFFSNYRSASEPPVGVKLASVMESIGLFAHAIDIAQKQLRHGEYHSRYAFGAAQMLPILAYHMGYDYFCETISAIIDDNLARQGLFFPALDVPIVGSTETTVADSQIVITALDSSKALVQRAIDMRAMSIVSPVGIL